MNNEERSYLRMSWKPLPDGRKQMVSSMVRIVSCPQPTLPYLCPQIQDLTTSHFPSITDLKSALHGQLTHSTFLNLVTLKGGLVFQCPYFTLSHQPALDFIIIPFPRYSWLPCCQPFYINKSKPLPERYCGILDPMGVSCSSEMSLLMKSRTLQSTLYNIPQFINQAITTN